MVAEVIYRKKAPDFSEMSAIMFQGVQKVTDNFFGNSPPQIFVGSKLKYPKVNVGILSPPEKVPDAWLYSAEQYWAQQKLDINTIIRLRSSLINSRFATTADQARSSEKFVDIAQQIGMAKRPVDVEIELKKKITLQFDTDKVNMPMGPRASLKDARLTENVAVDTHVEKVLSDTDLKATDAISYLYKHQFQDNTLNQLLSVGVLGLKKNRKLVPTRWSITAVDDMLGKQIKKEIRDYQQIDSYQLFHGSHLGNYYFALLFPDNFRYELFEYFVPGSAWNPTDTMTGATDWEDYWGRSQYAFSTAGGYYASRIAILEHLKKIKRQASALVIRFELPEYWASLGVWVCRASCRKTMANPPIIFPDQKTMVEYIKKVAKEKFHFDLNKTLALSKLLQSTKTQSKLSHFFR
ncbi:MAG: hypothetical protein Q8L34_03435 [Candidatus Woesearchaeota archaeon]|nr:hypothetical protein [Candidatus Woesearchaeota archaeon]